MNKYFRQNIILLYFLLFYIFPYNHTPLEKDSLFIKIEDRKIDFTDLFQVELYKYLVLFYSSSCMSCRDTLKSLNNKVKSKDIDIYSIDVNDGDFNNFIHEEHNNVGINDISEFYIYSYPILTFIEDKVVVKEIYGFENIRKENLYIFFE